MVRLGTLGCGELESSTTRPRTLPLVRGGLAAFHCPHSPSQILGFSITLSRLILLLPTTSYLRKGIPVEERKFPFDRLK